MHTKLKFINLLALDERNRKYSFFEFSDGLNIVHGKNTSGKSSLIQMLLYALGINDVKGNLADILNLKPIVRLECLINDIRYVFIRDTNNFYVKQGKSLQRYFGINGNTSAEHKILKDYIEKLFHFNLSLESDGKLASAPLEVMYLPYYISQEFGWISLRQSFGGLQFYKNFKADYLDYHLGIENSENRSEKRKLEEEKYNHQKELSFYKDFELQNGALKISKFADEEFMKYAQEYLVEYAQAQEELKKLQSEFIEKTNKHSYLKTQLQILKKLQKNQLKQNPEDGKCPVCENKLDPSLENIYNYHQSLNDTNKRIDEVDEDVRGLQGKINSHHKKIEELKTSLNDRYKIVQEYQQEEVNFKQWITNKSNLEIAKNLETKKEQIRIELSEVEKKLKKYQTDEAIKNIRTAKDKEFEKKFREYLAQLNIQNESLLKNSKFLALYNSFQFPTQGVENHKVFLAFNFAFNYLIKKNQNIHRLPFLLDAIFKEDIDDDNRRLIINFIKNNLPSDTQTIISIADSKKQKWSVVDELPNEYFVTIGENRLERALFEQNDFSKVQHLIDEIQEIIEKV